MALRGLIYVVVAAATAQTGDAQHQQDRFLPRADSEPLVQSNKTSLLLSQAQCTVQTGTKWMRWKYYKVWSDTNLQQCCTRCLADHPKCVSYMSYNDVDTGWMCYLSKAVPHSSEACQGHGGVDACSAGRITAPPAPKPKPKPKPPAPKPKPKPKPPAPVPTNSWPTFNTAASLSNSPWGKYYQAVYGNLPSSFPVNTEDLWMLYDEELLKARVKAPESVGMCPTANPSTGQRYEMNDQYQPRMVSWLWHKYPYQKLAANSWAEVFHQADPFGDEHYGTWFMYTPGSGIYFYTGKTIAFQEHQDGYTHFGVHSGDYNEELCKAAAGQGYDSLQFLAHTDHVNYQCDQKNTGHAGLKYMGLEIVAAKLVGTYPCGSPNGAPSSIKAGWMGSRKCSCNNQKSFINCAGVPSLALKAGREDGRSITV